MVWQEAQLHTGALAWVSLLRLRLGTSSYSHPHEAPHPFRVASFTCRHRLRRGLSGKNSDMFRLLTSCLQRMNDTLVSTTMSATYAVDKLLTSGMIKATLSQIATNDSGSHMSNEPSLKNSPCRSILESAVTRGLTHA